MPARHISESSSESGKGLTEIIKGVASILKEFPEISLQLYEWGDSVDLTKDLILKLGIENQVVWSKLVTRKVLKNRMANALAVIDQFKIPAFGAISTDAIAIGVPLLTSSNRDLNESFFGSDAPIFKTNIISDVQSNLGIILSERFNHIDYMSNSNIWYDTYLSSEVAFQKRLQTYKILLSE
jgi:glycosyltransferase involved in cell wall biosynthesis